MTDDVAHHPHAFRRDHERYPDRQPLDRHPGVVVPVRGWSFFTATGTSGPYDYLIVTLTNVLVSSYSVSSGGEMPSESISLNFVKMTMTSHIPQTATQSVSFDSSAP